MVSFRCQMWPPLTPIAFLSQSAAIFQHMGCLRPESDRLLGFALPYLAPASQALSWPSVVSQSTTFVPSFFTTILLPRFSPCGSILISIYRLHHAPDLTTVVHKANRGATVVVIHKADRLTTLQTGTDLPPPGSECLLDSRGGTTCYGSVITLPPVVGSHADAERFPGSPLPFAVRVNLACSPCPL